jgi:hypothetical protein
MMWCPSGYGAGALTDWPLRDARPFLLKTIKFERSCKPPFDQVTLTTTLYNGDCTHDNTGIKYFPHCVFVLRK